MSEEINNYTFEQICELTRFVHRQRGHVMDEDLVHHIVLKLEAITGIVYEEEKDEAVGVYESPLSDGSAIR